jgi:hypothetical protein
MSISGICVYVCVLKSEAVNLEIQKLCFNCFGLEVNAEKTKYTVMSQGQGIGRNHNIKVDNKCFERVEEGTYLGTTLTNRNSIHEEVNPLKTKRICII